MQDAKLSAIQSSEVQLIQSLVLSFNRPCGLDEIRQFNLLYGQIYPRLSLPDKRRTEALVDELIASLEDEKLASRIYGVV